jgi:hypothetical protein
MLVERYTPRVRVEWNAFVRASKNGNFLFAREYMDYHRERFADHSLVVRRRPGGAIVALLPAHRDGNVLTSHHGLTFGGVVSGSDMTLGAMADLLAALLEHLRAESIALLRYRAVPHIYHRMPADEDLYVLCQLGARLVERSQVSVLSLRHPARPQSRRVRGVRRARAAGLSCRESNDLAGFWKLLSDVLHDTYGARPVHTLSEITALQGSFPAEIRLHGCFAGDRWLAGTLVYESPTVARTQYIAASPEGRTVAALDLLLDHLVQEVYSGKDYIDLGSSAGNCAGGLNAGLVEFKESLGGRAVAKDTYELPTGLLLL